MCFLHSDVNFIICNFFVYYFVFVDNVFLLADFVQPRVVTLVTWERSFVSCVSNLGYALNLMFLGASILIVVGDEKWNLNNFIIDVLSTITLRKFLGDWAQELVIDTFLVTHFCDKRQ